MCPTALSTPSVRSPLAEPEPWRAITAPNARAPRSRSEEWATHHALPGGEAHAVRARYVTHQFARHAHAHAVIALVEAGALAYRGRGGDRVVQAGQMAWINPGEPHTGRAATPAGYAYWAFCPHPSLVARVAAELGARVGEARACGSGGAHDAVVDDAMLRRRLALLRDAVCGGAPNAEVEARALAVLVWLVSRGAPPCGRGRPRGERPLVRRAREYLDAHCREPVTLAALGALLGRSPFHVARAFRAEVGMPPHVYLEMRRVALARERLAAGDRLSEVAFDVGYADQAHFTRRFKAIAGMTPGAFARAVRGGAAPPGVTPLGRLALGKPALGGRSLGGR